MNPPEDTPSEATSPRDTPSRETPSRDTVSAELATRLRDVLELCSESLDKTAAAWPPDKPAPIWTEAGKWFRSPSVWTDWTPGFLAGQMWILAELLESDTWRERAIEFTRSLRHRRFDRDVHDLGFIFLSSWGRWLDSVDPTDREHDVIVDTLVTAATVQSWRWNGDGEHHFIYSFNGPQSLFIDVMMNVRLLFFARQLGASEQVYRRAVEHARTSARILVAKSGPGLGEVDGKVAHEAIFNTEPGRGEFRCLSTQQGYSPFTCWSRGLAWAIYGFTVAYHWTREAEFLETAERCAAFYLQETPESGVPYWDYGAPQIPDEPLDSSAAAIAGCGLLQLAEVASTPELAADCRRMAGTIGRTLTEDPFLGPLADGEEGLLLKGVYHRPRGWGVGGAVLWGDYFFLELIERLLKSRD